MSRQAAPAGHYDEKYFAWQKRMGEFGGMVHQFKFRDYVAKDDRVVDFGCGGGFLLARLPCRERIGVEINPAGRANAASLGVKAVESADAIEDGWADVIISDNALEHTHDPLGELKKLYPKLKKGGKIVFVLPLELRMPYVADDVNQHLFTWSPLAAGNLFKTAGFTVLKVDTIKRRWPPKAFLLRKLVGGFLFDVLCGIYGRCVPAWFQVRVVATK